MLCTRKFIIIIGIIIKIMIGIIIRTTNVEGPYVWGSRKHEKCAIVGVYVFSQY